MCCVSGHIGYTVRVVAFWPIVELSTIQIPLKTVSIPVPGASLFYTEIRCVVYAFTSTCAILYLGFGLTRLDSFICEYLEYRLYQMSTRSSSRSSTAAVSRWNSRILGQLRAVSILLRLASSC